MIIANALSRIPNPKKSAEILLDVIVDNILIDDIDEHQHLDLINFSISKRIHLRELFVTDRTMRALKKVVYQGWPATIIELPQDLHPYWSYRDEIGILDGVMFKGSQVSIPEALRQDILLQLHEAHLGIEKTRRLMHDSVYWPNIHIEVLIKSQRVTITCSSLTTTQNFHM